MFTSCKRSQICVTPFGSQCPLTNNFPELQKGSFTIHTNSCIEMNFSMNPCHEPEVVLLDDSVYPCAILNQTHCIFYKREVYDFWSKAWNTFWVQICITLCFIYIVCGTPIFLYYKKENSNYNRRSNFKMKPIKKSSLRKSINLMVMPTTYAIPKIEFSALFRAGLIPKQNEFSHLLAMDTQLHVLKFSTGNGAKNTLLNR